MSTMSKGGGSQIGATKSSAVKPLSTMEDLKKLQKERATFSQVQAKQLRD